jgi:hypothetical protein
MNIGSWIVGTAVLWLLKIIGTYPLATYLYRRKKPEYAKLGEGEIPESEKIKEGVEEIPTETTSQQATGRERPEKKKKAEEIPNKYYIIADVLVLGVAGFLLGFISGYYFIGISLKARDWPGMIVFIIASLLGVGAHSSF